MSQKNQTRKILNYIKSSYIMSVSKWLGIYKEFWTMSCFCQQFSVAKCFNTSKLHTTDAHYSVKIGFIYLFSSSDK